MPASLSPSVERRIVDKVSQNKLTIVCGPTGCGKSSLVPQALLEGIGGPILCTQPRRLAVVAVASYVAKQRNTALGGEEVGYHVGQDRCASDQTQLLFVTAGVLLADLKAKSIAALSRYKVVIIDECHERSCESDLVITIIREFLSQSRENRIKLVLMSATFNHEQYKSYFSGVNGCEFIDTINLQTANQIDSTHRRVDVHYLEDIKDVMSRTTSINRHEYMQFYEAMRNPNWELTNTDGGKALSYQLLIFVRALVKLLDEIELQHSVFLIFAPTYRHLEQMYNILISSSPRYDIDVLHSAIDIEDCLESMECASKISKRKILIASAIADSSITIENVGVVIDTCRSLEVKWDNDKLRYNAQTVWSSRAICDQRKGRTGRTCAGEVYRLVPYGFFATQMTPFERPKLELASCRDEILGLLSAANKVMSDPMALLKKTLDPPSSETVDKAVKYLQEIGSCIGSVGRRRTKLQITEHGKLLSSLPFTVEEAELVVVGAKKGLLHEALALVAISSSRPQPIVNAFGSDEANKLNLSRFFSVTNPNDPKSVALAQLAAYICWYESFLSIRRHEMKQHFAHKSSSDGQPNHFFGNFSLTHDDPLTFNISAWTHEVDAANSEWCRNHFINPSSVKSISQFVDVTMRTLYRSEFEPDWLKHQPLEPRWNSDIAIDSTENDVFTALYGCLNAQELTGTLIQLQSGKLRSVKKKRKPEEYACVHFLNGLCRFGESCKNRHDLSAPRPPCRFFAQGNCTKLSCPFSHADEDFEDDVTCEITPRIYGNNQDGGPVQWFKQASKTLLLIGSTANFRASLDALQSAPRLVLTGPSSEMAHFQNAFTQDQLHSISKIAYMFPTTSTSASETENASFLRALLMSASTVFDSKRLDPRHFEFAIALHSDQFFRWNVLSMAQDANLVFHSYEELRLSAFPRYNFKPNKMRVIAPRFYVFRSKKHVQDPQSKSVAIQKDSTYGIELEMSSSAEWTREAICMDLRKYGIAMANIDSFSEGKQTLTCWKLVGDGSIACSVREPNCNRFELVSPILKAEVGIGATTNILKMMSQYNIQLNRSMGFHVHYDVSRFDATDIAKICARFLQFEEAIDLIMPKSRRTGSAESNAYFQSNLKAAIAVLSTNEEDVFGLLSQCETVEDLAMIMNPAKLPSHDPRYFKLNFQNLVNGRQPTIEFRQHSSTANPEKVEAWIKFVVRFCENAVSSELPAFVYSRRSADESFQDLFQFIIRDTVLYSFYRKRKYELSLERGDDCNCNGPCFGK
mmetsp:Transcript_30569/g.69802  ORF Transcript_30569/g.69802 Transcript_30569/m.69802 type:complete len:1262 (+) Transcript_30569:283-4068(+)